MIVKVPVNYFNETVETIKQELNELKYAHTVVKENGGTHFEIHIGDKEGLLKIYDLISNS